MKNYKEVVGIDVSKKTIDASGKSVAPGFINMLSWL